MAIEKLYAGETQDDPLNSTGTDVATAVNALIDGAEVLPSIKQLRPTAGIVQTVEAFTEGSGFGGGPLIFYPDMSETLHNGGSIIAEGARLAWDGTQADIATILNYVGSDSGCYVRQDVISNDVNITWFGGGHSVLNNLPSLRRAVACVESSLNGFGQQAKGAVILPKGVLHIGESGDSYGWHLDRCNIIGNGESPFDTTIVWNGDLNATVVFWDAIYRKRINNVRFTAGTNKPDIWVDAQYNNGVVGQRVWDFGDSLDDTFFGDCLESCVKFPNIVNAYINGIRIGAARHPIMIKQSSSAGSNRVFSMSDWTIDYSGAPSGTLESLVQVDTTGSGLIAVRLDNFRIESTTNMGGVKALVEVIDTTGPNNIPVTGISLHLSNGNIQLVNHDTTSLLYQNTTQTTVCSAIALDMVYLEVGSVNKFYGGNWDAFFSIDEPTQINRLHNVYRSGRDAENNLPARVRIGKSLRFGNETTGCFMSYGAGSPEGSVSAPKGSLYFRTGGAANFTIYYKGSGTGNTGWVNTSIGTTGLSGGSGSAGAGNQYIEMVINGATYKILHDGTV